MLPLQLAARVSGASRLIEIMVRLTGKAFVDDDGGMMPYAHEMCTRVARNCTLDGPPRRAARRGSCISRGRGTRPGAIGSERADDVVQHVLDRRREQAEGDDDGDGDDAEDDGVLRHRLPGLIADIGEE